MVKKTAWKYENIRKLFEGNDGENQLLDDSISLSFLYPDPAID